MVVRLRRWLLRNARTCQVLLLLSLVFQRPNLTRQVLLLLSLVFRRPNLFNCSYMCGTNRPLRLLGCFRMCRTDRRPLWLPLDHRPALVLDAPHDISPSLDEQLVLELKCRVALDETIEVLPCG
ncbi:hypothetical protein GUJ93_ZPchr0007g3347 [Zizania palustris]|uniref:Secreted protein n=1 Tax=Zizania palustris TaxID=103762 RepID=A0A8J5TKH4_ZIZPA|nr:hypothetical protein GUJ93_ZPchr0007g3347 [Zizania palustris]